MTEPQGAVATVDETAAPTDTGTHEAQETTADGTTAPATEAPAEAEPAKPAGPSQEEVDAAVANFEALIQGTPKVGDDGSAVTVDDGEGNQVPVYNGDGVLDDEGRDTGTGVMTEALKDKIKAAYLALPAGSSKSSARPRVKDFIERMLGEAIEKMDTALARTVFTIKNECLTARGATGPTVAQREVSPTEAHIAKVVSLYLAAYLVDTPEGLEEGWADKANAQAAELAEPGADGSPSQVQVYAEWLHGDPETRGDEPTVADEVRVAARIASGKATRAPRAKKESGEAGTSTRAGGGYSGPKRDIGKHVAEFFDSKPDGYVALIGEIAKFQSNEYGDDRPSPGAVSARIWPAEGKPSSLAGIEQAMRDGKKAAKRVAVAAQPAA